MSSKWRDASRELTLLGIPVIAYLPVFIFLFHIRWWTFYLAIGVIAVFAILAKFGYTFKVLYRRFLHLLRGNRLIARPWWYRRRFQDKDTYQ